ncbi:MAG: exonuclease domain-containing protein [Saprospiraceae bacterium]|nr:exonuclease domain-containing protein [Saprospiraceae bacterium]MBK9221661.1 exonuclease domain-containing protein [Saprospiraceae bacterium]MBK9721403.1 exonuclease domain-containing protein [Saprospiraceae bacterium]
MNYFIIDLEATCWGADNVQHKQEIIEIGACYINSYMEVEKTFSKIIKPVAQPILSVYCKQLTGITQVEIDKAKSFNFVMEQFLDWCDHTDEPISLYAWGAKDRQLFNADCEFHRIGMDWLHEYFDLKSQFARIKGLPKPIGLDKALKLEEIDFEGGRHRALPDAINLSKLFVKYFEAWDT